MKVDAAPGARKAPEYQRALRAYEIATGQLPLLWLLLAALNLGTQLVFFYYMSWRAPGEFGTFNGVLGIVGLFVVPAAALPLVFRSFFMRSQSTRLDGLRAAPIVFTETFTWLWAVCCVVLMVLPLPLPSLPRFSLDVFATMNVLLLLGAVISGTVCAEVRQERLWALLLVAAGLVRLALGGWTTAYQPSAEAALAAYVVAGFVLLAPALRPREVTLAERFRVFAAALDGTFLRYAGAVLSVLLGIYLFTNADRIVALNWRDVKVNGLAVPDAPLRHVLDVYQATGLLARGLLWGTQPLLWIMYMERSVLEKTRAYSLRFFWIYLGTLVAGVLALGALAHFGALTGVLGPIAGSIGPTFAAVMIPLGLLQGLGMFALASRRYPECYLIGGCGIVYALVLDIVGGRPQMMLPLMFGASMVALMIVLFVGVVRWGRKQP
jgi:hypothetical protein